jgi:hypothetical protein
MPPLLLAGSGALGLLVRHGASHVGWVLQHGAALPYYGVINWHGFARLVGRSALIGATSAAIFWLACWRPARSRWGGWGMSLAVLSGAALLAWGIG